MPLIVAAGMLNRMNMVYTSMCVHRTKMVGIFVTQKFKNENLSENNDQALISGFKVNITFLIKYHMTVK